MNGRSAYLAGLGLLLVGLTATPASAQEAGDVGVTVSAPSAIGIIWHVTPRVAIRPDLAFSFSESDAEDGSRHQLALGLAGRKRPLLYGPLGQFTNLRHPTAVLFMVVVQYRQARVVTSTRRRTAGGCRDRSALSTRSAPASPSSPRQGWASRVRPRKRRRRSATTSERRGRLARGRPSAPRYISRKVRRV